jgi:hypothetical protein
MNASGGADLCRQGKNRLRPRKRRSSTFRNRWGCRGNRLAGKGDVPKQASRRKRGRARAPRRCAIMRPPRDLREDGTPEGASIGKGSGRSEARSQKSKPSVKDNAAGVSRCAPDRRNQPVVSELAQSQTSPSSLSPDLSGAQKKERGSRPARSSFAMFCPAFSTWRPRERRRSDS